MRTRQRPDLAIRRVGVEGEHRQCRRVVGAPGERPIGTDARVLRQQKRCDAACCLCQSTDRRCAPLDDGAAVGFSVRPAQHHGLAVDRFGQQHISRGRDGLGECLVVRGLRARRLEREVETDDTRAGFFQIRDELGMQIARPCARLGRQAQLIGRLLVDCDDDDLGRRADRAAQVEHPVQAQALLELGKRRDGDRQDTHEPHEQALREGVQPRFISFHNSPRTFQANKPKVHVAPPSAPRSES